MTGPRILIVDDSSTVRMMLREYLGREPGLEIAGTASNGFEALDRLQVYAPDVVLLDVDMPGLSGLDVLRKLSQVRPNLPVIMFSRLTDRGAVETIDALFLGASDYVLKPQGRAAFEHCVATELIPRLRAVSGFSHLQNNPMNPEKEIAGSSVLHPVAEVSPPQIDGVAGRVEVLALAASTGGPRALSEILPLLPANLPVPVVIVQHMPPEFTTTLARRLDSLTPFTVREVSKDESIDAANVWIAPGNQHMIVHRAAHGVRVQCYPGEPENSCRPSADVLFRSVAQAYGSGTLAAVLTGMGNDGLAGCRRIAEKGGSVLVQDEVSSAVWGMPGQVARAGLADALVPLNDLGRELGLRLTGRRPT